MTAQQKPFDVYGGDGAEKALVGALLINPRNLPEAASVINESDFRRRDLAAIYRAIVALSAAGQRVDTITVSNALATCGDIEERADALVTSLVAYSPSSLGVGAYAQIVREWALRRQAIAAAQGLVERASNDDVAQAYLVAWLAEQSERLAARQERTQGSIYETVSALFDRADEFSKTGGELPGLRTSFPILDRLLSGGWQKSALYLLAARPSVGKSAALLQAAVHAAASGRRVIYWSGEMSQESLVARIVSSRTWSVHKIKLPPASVSGGKIDESQWDAYASVLEWLSSELDGRLLIYDQSGITPQRLEGIAKAAQLQGGLDAVFVDYIGLMDAGERAENETVRITRISAALKRMASNLQLPVIAAAQLNRENERADREPILSDLRGSGSLEQDADSVAFLHTEETKMAFSPRPVQLIVAKNRNGALGRAAMSFIADAMLLVEQEKK